jgi:hypothetical protein
MKEYAQVTPWPQELEDLVAVTEFRPGWTVRLYANYPRDYPNGDQSQPAFGHGTTLVITADTVNSYPPHDPIRVRHLFVVPAATYNRASWQRWLFEQFVLVDRHETMEFFTVDGEKPYAPNHGPGCDPYIVHDLATDEQRRTSFRGELNSS